MHSEWSKPSESYSPFTWSAELILTKLHDIHNFLVKRVELHRMVVVYNF
jgi:hypothetical protein